MDYALSALGRTIRDLRVAKHLTQDQLGSDAGYGAGAGVSISRIENGFTRPSEKSLAGIAFALGVTPRQLESDAAKRTVDFVDAGSSTAGEAGQAQGQAELEARAARIRQEVERRERVSGELTSAFEDAWSRARTDFFEPLLETAEKIDGADRPDTLEVSGDGVIVEGLAVASRRLPLTPPGVAESLVKGANGVVLQMAPAVGRATARGTFKAVAALGRASTGAATSDLYGVAQSNAVLSILGGGTRANGGFGVSGGTKVLTGIKIGATVLFAISPIVVSAMRSRLQRQEFARVLDDLDSEINASQRGVDALIDVLGRSTSVLDEIAVHGGRAIKKWTAQLGPEPRAWDALAPAEQERYQDFVQIADCLLEGVAISTPDLVQTRGDERESLIEVADTVLNRAEEIIGSLL